MAQLVLKLKQNVNRLTTSENKLMRQLADSIEMTDLARLGQTKVVYRTLFLLLKNAVCYIILQSEELGESIIANLKKNYGIIERH